MSYKELYKENAPMSFESTCNSSIIYGKRIREERKRLISEKGKCYTVYQLANMLGVEHSTITKIEKGYYKKIKLKYLDYFSYLFNCSPLYLLGKSKFRDCLTENYCFPNPSNNYTLREYIKIWEGYDIYINGKKKPCGIVLKDLLDITRSNPNGITIRRDKDIRKIYYFSRKDFVKIRKPRTRTEEHIDNMDSNNFKEMYNLDADDIYNAMDHNDEINSVMIMQYCTNRTNLIRFFEPPRSTNAKYIAILENVFGWGTPQYKNTNILDLLSSIHDLDEINLSLLLTKLVKIINDYDHTLSSEDIYSLIQIMNNFYEANTTKRKEILYFSYNKKSDTD